MNFFGEKMRKALLNAVRRFNLEVKKKTIPTVLVDQKR